MDNFWNNVLWNNVQHWSIRPATHIKKVNRVTFSFMLTKLIMFSKKQQSCVCLVIVCDFDSCSFLLSRVKPL